MSLIHPERGLLAMRAATRVQDDGPLRYGPEDGVFWVYEEGVWRPGDRDVQGRIVRALGEQYRPHHAVAIRDVLKVVLDEQWVHPVPSLINFSDGLLRWNAPDEPHHFEHHPESGSTVQLPVKWRWDAECPEFDAFLEQAVPEDDRARVWEVLGYMMMSGNPLQRMVLLTGGGGNGKGVLLAVIQALLGHRNVANVPLGDFADDTYASADVFGKLANICGDLDTGFIEKTGKIKQMAGEDHLRAQRKYGQPFSFEYWGKMIFSANAIPQAADSSTGWLRRWEVIRFPYAPANPDRGLKTRLTQPDVLEGVAVKAVWALRELMKRGDFDRGESATQAHREFAKRNNSLLAWIDDDMYENPEVFLRRAVLYDAFAAWYSREHNGAKLTMSRTSFYERLRQVPGVVERKRRGHLGFRGLGRKEDTLWVDLTGDDDEE